MAVTLPSVYKDGTATIAANGTVVTGQSTLFTKALLAGDWFGLHKGYAIRILSVDSDTQLTLANPWPGGAQTAAAYEIMLQSDNARMAEGSRQLMLKLMSGNVDAFAGLVGAANSLPMFTGPGAMSLFTMSTIGKNVLGAATSDAARIALGFGTSALVNTGTSGGAIPLLNAANTWSATQTIANGALILNSATPADRPIQFSTANSLRWRVRATSTTEAGSDAGSNFSIDRYSDTGVLTDSPLSIARASGLVNLANGLTFGAGAAATTRTNLGLGTAALMNTGTSGASLGRLDTANTWSTGQTIGLGTGTAQLVLDGASGGGRNLFGRTAGSNRWVLVLGNTLAETGANAGSDLVINRYDDAGANIGSPFSIARSTGITTLSNLALAANGAISFGGTGASTTLTNLGVSAFIKTLLDDADASTAQTTLGVSAFVKTILDDANAAAVFATLGATLTLGSGTFIAVFPNGFIIQGGLFTGAGTNPEITFPVAFPNNLIAPLATMLAAPDGTSAYTISIGARSKTTAQFYRRTMLNGGTVTTNSEPFFWLALGN